MTTHDLVEEARQLPKQLREDFLRNHCTNVQVGQYFKRFDETDKQQSESDLTAKVIELVRLQQEFDDIKAQYKAKIKIMEQEKLKILGTVMQNGEWCDGEQFMFADQKRGVMDIYDEAGEFITTRRLLPEEKQMTIFDDRNTISAQDLGMVTKSKNLGE